MFQRYIDSQYRRPSGIVGLWIGEQMLREHQPENRWTVDVLDVQPADHILEIGFGAGFAVQEIEKRLTTGAVAGIDLSEAMVSAARRRNRRAVQAGRVDLRHGSVLDMPWPDRHFDKAFSIHSIYFWPKPRVALESVYRVLRPGGLFVVTLLPTERWKESFGTPVATPEFTPYSGASLRAALAQVGFINIYIKADPNPANPSSFSVIAQRPTPD